MSINKNDFKNAFREAVSEEYSDIPNEQNIEYEFSKKFNEETHMHISSPSKTVWKFLNSTSKKIAAVILAIALSTSSAFAVTTTVIKIKNKYKLVEEQEISETNNKDDFIYTKFDDIEREITVNESRTNITESFKDPKINIYNKMLNTFDYFNEAELTVKTSMLAAENSEIKLQTNVDEKSSYQAVKENGITVNETFGSAQSEFLMYVNNRDKTYGNELGIYSRADAPYIPLNERVETGDDGIPCYKYRRNATNCTLASYSLYPQEMTYSYLADFKRWDIADEEKLYLQRECIEIKGRPNSYFSNKHSGDSFNMLVDKETGILMKFEIVKNGSVENYITVTECYIGKTKTEIKQFDLKEYDGYTERDRNYIPN